MIRSLALNGRKVDLNKISSLKAKTEFESSTIDFLNRWLSGQIQFRINTSGSTGKPKTITITRQQMEASARATNTYFGLDENDTIYLCLNSAFIAGQMMIVRAMLGKFHLIADEPSATPKLTNNETPIHFAALIPMQANNLIDNGILKNINGLKAIIIGGAAIDSGLELKLQSINTPAYATFGMTETVSHIALRRINGAANSEVYETLPGVKIGAKNECLTIKGAITSNIQILTTDRVKLVSPTSFKWLGRIDNVVNSGGIKIQIEEVEHLIEPTIKDLLPNTRFVCSKRRDDKLGEKLVLVVEGAIKPLQSEQLLQRTKDLLPRYWAPKEILSISQFPETVTSKIDRASLYLSIENT
ncbi:MAG: AMP-binding protein [Bacteroidota bacterium]